MNNWFPLCKSMMEDSEEFRCLTPVEKLYFTLIISKFNLWGEFDKTDLLMAVTLGVSEDKVRRARRKIQRLGWLGVRPGFKSRGKGVATRYLSVKWSKPEEGKFFAQFQRFTLKVMLSKIRKRNFNHADIVVYIYLSYLQWKNRGKRKGDFFITKTQLRKLTNISNAPARVERLYKGFDFAEGAHLFEYNDEYHKLSFSGWAAFADPSDDENNRKCEEIYRKEIEHAIKEVKRKRQALSGLS